MFQPLTGPDSGHSASTNRPTETVARRTRSPVWRIRLVLLSCTFPLVFGLSAPAVATNGGAATSPSIAVPSDPATAGQPKQPVLDRVEANHFALQDTAPASTTPTPDSLERTRRIGEWLNGQIDQRDLTRQPAAVSPAVSTRARQMAQAQGSSDLRRFREISKTLAELRGRILQPAEQGPWTEEERDKRTARAFLRAHRKELRLRDPDSEMRLVRIESDALGHRHARFAQTYRGLAVWGNGLIVQMDANGNAISMNGAYVPTPPRKLITKPALDTVAAIDHARRAIPGGDGATVGQPELVVHASLNKVPRLAWMVEVNVNVRSAWRVAVDALNGTILATYPLVMDANASGSGIDLFNERRPLNVWATGQKYYLVDTSKTMFDRSSTPPDIENTRGAIIILDANDGAPDNQGRMPPLNHVTSSSATTWLLKDAVSAAFNLSKTYDYYRKQHQRTSLDGQGSSIIGVVRFRLDPTEPMENAFWNSQFQAMFFGDARPLAGATDVIGHELTHGVTEHTAGLVYQNQPGALNEAMSDIFGEMVEARLKKSAPDWLTGGPPLNWVLRDFIDPNRISCGLAPCPAHMREFIHTDQDHGGVHLNSSIINHAYYLLAEGLPAAIGLTDAERIFYRTLTTKLLPQSEFIDARRGAIASSEELFGDTSSQVDVVRAAFDAVGILDAPPTPEPPPNNGVKGPDSSLFVYWNGFGYYLARRETALGDGTDGVYLSDYPIAPSRPSISGDGSIAAFVDEFDDLCLIYTDGSESELCLGMPGLVYSVALSRDQRQAAFVFLDDQGEPENKITIIDLDTGESETYRLTAPVMDGGSINVLLADVMEFTADGKGLVYDAYNVLTLKNGSQIGLWSIYRMEIASGNVVIVAPPTPGFDIGNPTIGKTSDTLLAFEAIETASGQSTVIATNTFTGKSKEVATIEPSPLYASPSFTGKDRDLVYAVARVGTWTGSYCVRQPLASDHLTPAGSTLLWVEDGAHCKTYRRGSYTPPQHFSLTVQKQGNGDGLIGSVPSGINCGTACLSQYLTGTKVSLTVAPTKKSRFLGWSGHADCTDGQVTLNADKTCIARFRSTLAVVKVDVVDTRATEAGLTTGKFRFTRHGNLSAALEVQYLIGGTATEGKDYRPLGSSVTFPPGSASVTLKVKPLQDGLEEPDEKVVLTLSEGANYLLTSGASSAKVTITSDD